MEKRDSTKPLLKAGIQSPDDPMEFVLSDETADKHGDIVRASGWNLSDFKKNPIALYGHRHDATTIIGVWQNVRVEGKKLLGRLKLAEQGTSEIVDVVRSLLEQGILKAVSVGMSILEYTPRDANEPWGGWEITQQSLNEASVVAVGANPKALAIAKAACTPETARLLFAQPGEKSGLVLPEDNLPGQSSFDHETPRLDAARERLSRLGVL